jgi:hypothetical protein
MYRQGYALAKDIQTAKLRSKERVISAGLLLAKAALDDRQFDLSLQTLLALDQLCEPVLVCVSFQVYSSLALVLTPISQLKTAKHYLEKTMEVCTAPLRLVLIRLLRRRTCCELKGAR